MSDHEHGPGCGHSKYTAQWVTRDALALALHATAPHSKFHSWESCPQQDFDYRDADDILRALALQADPS